MAPSQTGWTVLAYKRDGHCPVDEFLARLELRDPLAALAFNRSLLPKLLADGTAVGKPYLMRTETTGLLALQWDGSRGTYCICLSEEPNKLIVLYAGARRRDSSFPLIRHARGYLESYRRDK